MKKRKEAAALLFYRMIGFAYVLIVLAVFIFIVYLALLVVKALRKYINSTDVREEKAAVRKSLAELLKENRIRCKMTQEFVSEAIGVSRQAVSKWENGSADPSTSNLIALAKLYGVSAEDLLKNAAHKKDSENLDNIEDKG